MATQSELNREDAGPKALTTQLVSFKGETHSFPKSWDDTKIAQALSGREEQPKVGKILHGRAAVKRVEKDEGKLTEGQKHLVTLEGYSKEEYSDTKGVKTRGVGQTGKFASMTFKEVYEIHVERAKSRIPAYGSFPASVQQELIQAEYRGDLALSPKFLTKLNAGQFRSAAAEFLDNDDYRESLVERTGVHKRMKLVHDSLISLADKEVVATDDLAAGLAPSKGGLFEDEAGVLFLVDAKGNKKEV